MLRDKARQIGIKFGAVQTILTDILGMSKSQLDGSSELLTKDQKNAGLISISCLSRKIDLRNGCIEL